MNPLVHYTLMILMKVLIVYGVLYKVKLKGKRDSTTTGSIFGVSVQICNYIYVYKLDCVKNSIFILSRDQFEGDFRNNINIGTPDHVLLRLMKASRNSRLLGYELTEIHIDVDGILSVADRLTYRSPRRYVYGFSPIQSDKYTNVSIRICRDAEIPYGQFMFGPNETQCTPCTCYNREKCDGLSGQCVRCDYGFTGSSCSDNCSDGQYGVDCTSTCSTYCSNICDKRNGNCHCLDGYAGKKCDRRCDVGKYGRYCTQTCGGCKAGCGHVAGNCTGGCLIGHIGSKCRPCQPGTYGVNCTKRCHCFKNYACNYTSGNCGIYGCGLRWIGDSCDVKSQCVANKWGKACIECGGCSVTCPIRKPCQLKCESETGVCLGQGCLENYIGPRCARCRDTKYGRKCRLDCGNCGASCDVITGVCSRDSCIGGFMGNKCDLECKHGFRGRSCVDKCSAHCENGQCSPIDGKCIIQCPVGWMGEDCTEIVTCANGLYGDNCHLRCNRCMHGKCAKYTGVCILGCHHGYWGSNCSHICRSGSYGQDCAERCGVCFDWSDCHIETGVCERGCMGQFVPPMCTVCPEGYVGPRCDTYCGHCSDNELCDSYTGACRAGCAVGFTGSYCDDRIIVIIVELDESL